MSVDRYVAVCQIFTVFSKWLRKRETAWMITAAVWAMALFTVHSNDAVQCQLLGIIQNVNARKYNAIQISKMPFS